MEFSFKNLLSNLNLFQKSTGSVIGIDLGSSAIKIVQLKKKGGRAILETYGELALGPYAGTEVGRATNLPLDKLIEATSDLMREANITSKDAAISIPLSSSLISVVEMPALPDKRMAEMVPIEARRYIPVPISEVALDWWVIPKEERTFTSPAGAFASKDSSTKVDVLLVAILNEAIQKNQNLSKGLSLADVFFEIEIFSTVRAVLDQGIQPVMILDMGAASTKLYLVEHGVVRDSHIINRGAQDITLALSRALNIPVARAEEVKRTVGLSSAPEDKNVSETILLVLNQIFIEANRVLLSFEKRCGKTVSQVVLSGGGAVLKGFVQSAKVHFSSEVVSADPFSKLSSPAFLTNLLKGLGPEFAVSVGIALRKLNQFE